MAVIVDLTLPAETFQMGRILSMTGDANIDLETMVPMGGRGVPFFRVIGEEDTFEKAVREHESVADVTLVNTHEDERLYAIKWDLSSDEFFMGVTEWGGTLLKARGSAETWQFELRFPSHERLSDFQNYCRDADLPIDVRALYNPTRPTAGPWFGLTTPQRAALTRAVEGGYYRIPREISTQALGEELDISDQAVTERLRRAIDNLVRNTLLLSE